ncbi:MAG: hypothetical protein HYZ20_04775 [Burkholderiales bacterium]|nr:hypothetical protein [Burkholderiales bacterium]
MLRPQVCRWFELVCAREQLTPALATLAAAGSVELQAHEPAAPFRARDPQGVGGRPAAERVPLVRPEVDAMLKRFRELARLSHGHWPAASPAADARIGDPAATLAARLAELEAWHAEAGPLIGAAEGLQSEVATLDAQRRLLACDPALLPSPALLGAGPGLRVEARVYAGDASPRAGGGAWGGASGGSGPADARAWGLTAWPAAVLALTIPCADAAPFVVLLGAPAALAALEPALAARRAHRLPWPTGLPEDLAAAQAELGRRHAALAARRDALARQLAALAERRALATVLGDIALVQWLLGHGAGLATTERLVWVSGWTTAPDPDALVAPLRQRGLHAVAQFGAPPAGAEPPSQLVNPPWARPFEAFARLLGQPGRDEADPSPLLALIAPLLFGFMFGDVGQGAVLLLAGLALRRRWPALVMLVPGGAMAMLFGLLFGSVFAREDLIPALWLHPLHAPVTLLAAAVALGAAILLGGLALGAMQAVWRGAARDWWAHDAPLLLAYSGGLAAPWWPAALWAVGVGAAWAALGGAWRAAPGSGQAAGAARGLARFVEQALQLAVNTVSFARVGAFALAHAGLSAAVVGVADAAGGLAYGVLLVLGNLLILVLEGLVVGIQTTRLLLFEFFLRFLQGRGRPFRPLPPLAAPTA